jgi:hypothetical protein
MLEKNYLITNKHILFSFFFIIVVVVWNMFLDENLAILSLAIISIVLGSFLILIIHPLKEYRNAFYLFLLFYLIYLSYTSIVHYGLLNFYDVINIVPDEHYFYRTSNEAYLKIQEGYSFSEMSEMRMYKDTIGVIYLNGLVATLANLYGDNSVFIQKMAVVFIASLIPMVMYGISRLYFSERVSINVALIYGLFSFLPYLSGILLRDTHIALMFILTIYIILQRFSILNFVLLFFVVLESYFLRPQTGIFMMGFISIYLFVFIRKTVVNKYMEMFIYFIITLFIVAIIVNSSLMEMFTLIEESSAERGASTTSSGSLGAIISKLPFGLNIVAQFGFSQIQPFPPAWIFKGSNRGFFEFWYLIAAISWFFGWGFLIYGLKVKKIFKNQDLKIKIMFYLAIIYLVLITIIEFNQRRQMAVYPILYLLMVFSYMEMSISERTKMWIGMGLFYIILVLLINYIKL